MVTVPATLDVVTAVPEASNADIRITSYNDQLVILGNTEILSTKIYNQLGQIVKESDAARINTSSLRTGIYFVRVITNNGEIVKKVFID